MWYAIPSSHGHSPHFFLYLFHYCKSKIYVWNIQSETLVRAIHLPETCQSVQHLQFVWRGPDTEHSELLAVLGQDGIVRIIHLELAEVLATVGPPTEAFIDQFLLCSNGRCASTPDTCPMTKKSKSNASLTTSSRLYHCRSSLLPQLPNVHHVQRRDGALRHALHP